jgi:hypothetical protein
MLKPVIAFVSIALVSLGSPLLAAPHGGGRYVGSPIGATGPGRDAGRPGVGGAYVGARPAYGGNAHYGGYPHYGGWRGGYWGPRVGFSYGYPGYWGGWPGYWGSWPWGWGASYGYGYGYGYGTTPVYLYDTPQTQVYTQQDAAASAAPQAATEISYWYYCTEPSGYFPYVKNCSQAWLKVVPQAPGEQHTAPRVAP